MSENEQKYCHLKKNEQKVSIYLTESPSRENYNDYQVRIYGDGETNKDIRFKCQNFNLKNTENSYTSAIEYYNERKQYYLELGFKEKIGLLAKIKNKLKIK